MYEFLPELEIAPFLPTHIYLQTQKISRLKKLVK